MKSQAPASPSPHPPWRPFHSGVLLAILLLALVMRATNLGFPEVLTFDEIYYVKAAQDYLEGRPDSNSVHPPLAKIQLALALLTFEATRAFQWHHGADPIGWRCLPVLLGTGLVALTAWLAWTLTRRPRLALLAAALVAIEHLSVAESRITTLDTIQAFWITLGFCMTAQRLTVCQRNGWLWGSALAFGVATACKWNGLFAAFAAFLALAGLVAPQERKPRLEWLRVALVFGLGIGLVYALSYLPYRQLYPEKSISVIASEIEEQHLRMIRFRYDAEQFKHPYISGFHSWPFVARPVWLHFKTTDQSCTGIVAFGLLPFWWFSFYLVLETLASAWRRRSQDRIGQFLVLAYLCQWLLWASSTTGGFFYYMVPVVPIMAILVARTLDSWLDQAGSRNLALAYLLVLILGSLLYYPFMSGLSVPYRYFQALFFVPGWV